MATDIAFALGALVLLGARISRSVLTFLLALAIVDDLGALVVIALFCTKTLDGPLLLMALMWIGVLVLFNRVGVRRPWPYFVLGLLLWATLLKSGVHATLAGVATAFAIPARPKYDPTRFAELFDTLLQRYRSRIVPGESILRNQGLRSVLQTMENSVLGVMPPLQRPEHKLHTPVAILIIPLFALANAGIPLDSQVRHLLRLARRWHSGNTLVADDGPLAKGINTAVLRMGWRTLPDMVQPRKISRERISVGSKPLLFPDAAQLTVPSVPLRPSRFPARAAGYDTLDSQSYTERSPSFRYRPN